jgi:NAD(P)-dependent dehydrogenase (short-subunit alcohol dehydrogenase family)
MVFIGSKNSIYAGKNASAYSSAKALEAHLARCIAAEGGEFGIRVNTVLPDAILQGCELDRLVYGIGCPRSAFDRAY